MKPLKVRDSLSTRALVLGLINAGGVLILALIAMGFAYRRSFGDFIKAPILYRIFYASQKISLDLIENNSESWSDILNREAQGTPFQYVLLDSDGREIAGQNLLLPKSVQAFAATSPSQLSYVPKFELNERHDERYEFEYAKNFVFLTRDQQTHIYWAGVHVLIHYMNEDMYGHGTLVWRFSSLWTNSYFFSFWPYVVLFGAPRCSPLFVGFLLHGPFSAAFHA